MCASGLAGREREGQTDRQTDRHTDGHKDTDTQQGEGVVDDAKKGRI